MDEDEESLPIFRHFTREDLAIIENVIFENKLREKKKEERRQQNIKVSFFISKFRKDLFKFSTRKACNQPEYTKSSVLRTPF